MPFLKINVTEEESLEMLTRNEELELIYDKCCKKSVRSPYGRPTIWFINEEENASFCMLELDRSPYGGLGNEKFMLRVKNSYIVFQLKDYNTVLFLHDSPLLENELYKVKYLITAAFSVAGRWGDGQTENILAVPDPVFTFSQER